MDAWVMTLREKGVKYLFVKPEKGDYLGNLRNDPNAHRRVIKGLSGYLIPLSRIKLASTYDRTGTPLTMVDTDGELKSECLGLFDPVTYEFSV